MTLKELIKELQEIESTVSENVTVKIEEWETGGLGPIVRVELETRHGETNVVLTAD